MPSTPFLRALAALCWCWSLHAVLLLASARRAARSVGEAEAIRDREGDARAGLRSESTYLNIIGGPLLQVPRGPCLLSFRNMDAVVSYWPTMKGGPASASGRQDKLAQARRHLEASR